MGVTDDLLAINGEVCRELWKVVDVQTGVIGALTPKLVIPFRTDLQGIDLEVRVSEQEARFIYASVLIRSGKYFFSVETPTKQKHNFQGTGSNRARSALFDLRLWTFDNGFKEQANVEFKAGNAATRHIEKDIKKLVAAADRTAQGTAGNWFHILKNVDSGTLPKLFSKIEAACKASVTSPAEMEPIVFCFCVLEKCWAIQKIFAPQGSLNTYCPEFFKIDYKVSNGEVTVNDARGWYQVMP